MDKYFIEKVKKQSKLKVEQDKAEKIQRLSAHSQTEKFQKILNKIDENSKTAVEMTLFLIDEITEDDTSCLYMMGFNIERAMVTDPYKFTHYKVEINDNYEPLINAEFVKKIKKQIEDMKLFNHNALLKHLDIHSRTDEFKEILLKIDEASKLGKFSCEIPNCVSKDTFLCLTEMGFTYIDMIYSDIIMIKWY